MAEDPLSEAQVHVTEGERRVVDRTRLSSGLPAEAFRRRITTLELHQIIGRGRGIWRTADNPLHVLLLTDVPLELPIEELTTANDERSSFEDRQIAADGIAFDCAEHITEVSTMTRSERGRAAERARYAKRRYGRGQPAGTVAYRYQLAGQGQREQLAYALPEIPADAVRAFITERLGLLVRFEWADRSACDSQSGKTDTENSTHFGADAGPERPRPFVWRAWTAWRVDHPPDS